MRATTEPPEAAGPGIPEDAGGVTYGDEAHRRNYPNVVIPPRRDPEEVARERARTPYRCGFCIDIPEPLLAAIRGALDEARKETPQ
jgi:hypothetical protein